MARPFGSVARTWKALGVVVAMALVAVVLIATPGNATFAKKYDLVMSSTPSPITAGTSATVQATFTNKSLYTIRSVTVSVPSNRYMITMATAAGPVPTIASDGSKVSVTGLNLQLNKPYTITMTVSVACDAATGSWGSTAKTSGGTSFSLNNPGNSQTTTVSGACPPDSITFLQGPTDTAAGGTMSDVIVQVMAGSNPASGVPVSLTSDGLATSPTSPPKNTGPNGQVTFSGAELTVKEQAGPYTMTASSGSLTTGAASFNITAGTPIITFTQQPTDSLVDTDISPAVVVHAEDEFGNDVSGLPIGLTISPDSFNPSAGLTGGSAVATDSSGDATFSNLQIDTTSSGYKLRTTVDDVDSEVFAITNTDQSCTNDCSAEFPEGGTVSAPEGTTLIIENNSIVTCDGAVTNAIAGTVTIIPPTGPGTIEITFTDPYENILPIELNKTYPVCKGDDAHPDGQLLMPCSGPSDVPCVISQNLVVGPLDLVTVIRISQNDPPVRH